VDEGALTLLSAEFQGRFDQLAESLPPRFTTIVDRVRRDLPALFASDSKVPLVLTHGDMCEMNLLVDPPSCELTGMIDWTEGRTLPFGFALYGLENLLGFMDSEGWHYYDNADQLRSLFWRVFQEETRNNTSKEVLRMMWTLRMAGILYRYGLIHDGTAVHGVVGPENSSLRYLDAFCTWDGWAQTE
jgi:Ser/Thr protein kinase RdoA (MazF antagonist)